MIRLLLLCLLCVPHSAMAIYPAPAESKLGMVVTEHELATQAGVTILKKGGNAIDAAVAVGYALAVVNPCCGNIGGGGFMLARLADGKEVFLNFREKAPLAAFSNMYLNSKEQVIPGKSTQGYLAVAVPGTVLGLETALKRYGTMTRQQVMAPAIQLAKNGFILQQADIDIMKNNRQQIENTNSTAIFRQNYQPGDRFVQKNLARTLSTISQQGYSVFYRGAIAKAVVEESNKAGGILTLKDFSNYTVEELTPIHCQYRHYSIISAPPPSSGGVTLCEMLTILEGYPLQDYGFHSAQSAHYMIEAMHYAYADRNQALGDPDFVKNPIELLLSPAHINTIRHKIQKDHASISEATEEAREGITTTHYSIMDKWGNAVAVTYTINSLFGAGVIAGDTGFFLNNEMDDFTAKSGVPNQFGLVQGQANAIQPGKRPLSSMTPTIIMNHDNVFMVLGSPGGSRIITTVLQTLSNVIDYGMDIQAAVDSPRFHHQYLPAMVEMEPLTFSADTLEKLIAMGHRFNTVDPWSAVEAITVNQQRFYGGTDHRRKLGLAKGL